jgi:tetratricopeptide (TPR) repeat protein
LRRAVRYVLWVVVLALVGAGGWLILRESRTNANIREAAAALDSDDTPAALRLLERPLADRTDSAEVQFLAARAYRIAGNLPEARKRLQLAKKLGWVPEAIDLEIGLLQAQTDTLTVEYDFYLRKCLRENHPDVKYIAQVLAHHDYAKFRLLDADRASEIWTQKAPRSATAWAFRGDVCDRTRKRAEAIAAYRMAVELDPANVDYALALARNLLNAKAPPDDVAVILEKLQIDHPDRLDVLLQLAYCRTEQARPEDALPLVERVIAKQSDSIPALHLKGRIELALGRPERAVTALRRAAELGPYHTDVLFTLLQTLNQTGPADEAAAIKARWTKSSADLEKLGTTTREITSNPDNPELRKTAGEICLRNGLEKEGVQWLTSALRLDPSHKSSHGILADYYEKIGDRQRAAEHRARAGK